MDDNFSNPVDHSLEFFLLGLIQGKIFNKFNDQESIGHFQLTFSVKAVFLEPLEKLLKEHIQKWKNVNDDVNHKKELANLEKRYKHELEYACTYIYIIDLILIIPTQRQEKN